jgi:hypothetical protein
MPDTRFDLLALAYSNSAVIMHPFHSEDQLATVGQNVPSFRSLRPPVSCMALRGLGFPATAGGGVIECGRVQRAARMLRAPYVRHAFNSRVHVLARLEVRRRRADPTVKWLRRTSGASSTTTARREVAVATYAAIAEREGKGSAEGLI